jgi:hypothetical protein
MTQHMIAVTDKAKLAVLFFGDHQKLFSIEAPTTNVPSL